MDDGGDSPHADVDGAISDRPFLAESRRIAAARESSSQRAGWFAQPSFNGSMNDPLAAS
jgi:hypothetical protein